MQIAILEFVYSLKVIHQIVNLIYKVNDSVLLVRRRISYFVTKCHIGLLGTGYDKSKHVSGGVQD